MNSWGDDPLEKRIDELLTSSVSRGSEPSGLVIAPFFAKPSFPWMKIAYVLVAAVILGFFTLQWLSVQNLETVDYRAVLSFDAIGSVLSRLSSGKIISAIAIAIGLGGTVVAFLSEKQRVLHRVL